MCAPALPHLLICGIDPGTTNYGYAILDDRARIVKAGTRRLCKHGSSHAAICTSVVDVAGALFLDNNVTHVSIEAQMRASMHCVAAATMTTALLCGCDSQIVHATRWRKRLDCDLANAGSHDKNKTNSVDLVKRLYDLVVSDHAADAILIALGRLYELQAAAN
jgi:Holliday junction resolvasome RuvABC endonuclease subunit